MALTSTDWIVIGIYLALNLLISLYYRRRSSGSTEEFFVSGRNVSWWLAGTSMVATTFADDTPLLVTGLVAKNGISGNWLWWSQCLSGMMTVFFFARYWRRAEILTDVEFVELRYGGKPAAFLRGFRALYLGALMNCLILGWVIKAMINITTVLLGDAIRQGRVLEVAVGGHVLMHYALGDPKHTALLICVLVLVPFTGIYTFIGGLWGVSYWRWLFVDLLFVPAAHRGQGLGTALLNEAEAKARERGCIGVWLLSFSFQAPQFYQRLGYRPFGTIGDYPPGHNCTYLFKRFG